MDQAKRARSLWAAGAVGEGSLPITSYPTHSRSSRRGELAHHFLSYPQQEQ